MPDDDAAAEVTADEDLPGAVGQPIIEGLPDGYTYGVTRHADIILQGAYSSRLNDLIASLDQFTISLDELRAGGGGRTKFVARFDQSLRDRRDTGVQVWGKQNITISKRLGFDDNLEEVARTRGHEIDMFGLGHLDDHLPGVAVEMEWNNKDPFYDRDLNNFSALHREGAIAAGVIVTRGPRLQELIGPVIRSKDGGLKYGQSSTHWDKLVPRVNLGGGGECPLLLVGIEPERVTGIELVVEVSQELAAAKERLDNWRDHYSDHREAQRDVRTLREAAKAKIPPVK
ncbi:BglII/BstYI family type II restriction endonuclease [Actinomarinicola tropica]|uniref:BglII/BstYI family type II restriction endonuclease n=1 Tax=Actinomarinicola tropica TaxID=2789776 RepID=UPI00189995D9|nr:BglII/BstYI family type II restriction endonuclease [Actinomarinicola tropica]